MRPTFLFVLPFLLAASPLSLSAAPQWIWLSKDGNKDNKVTFRHRFEVPVNAHHATLELTCDNGADALLNGKKVLSNPDWQKPTKADISKDVKRGEANELIVEARNTGSMAALIARLTIKLADGKEQVLVETNGQWEAATSGTQDFKKAVVINDYGKGPWGLALDGKAGGAKNDGPAESVAASEITVPKGFKVEKLYNVPKDQEGSWVALTVDPKGRLIACDQYGSIYRMSVPAVGKTEALKPQKLDIAMGKAHGLLAAFDSLYVMVNEDGKNNGLYRLTDTNGDDQYDKTEKLHTMQGGGEHGLHSMTVSPDGRRIFFNCGNHTKLPEGLAESRPAKIWAEDHVLPRMWDARGHARGILAPGGYICSMNPDGSGLELFCYGFRNEFDIAFNDQGELFTYDADMEWDIGSPWYRPTRVNHCVSGADYGWRSGSGKWPNYYPDSLPTTVDIGPGSPTGVVAGTGAKFPAKYQHAVFINDWTYGTMWAIHLEAQGASYKAIREEFVYGKPLPLTDVVIHPQDGAMYFAVGGRKTQSGVYRVTYVGDEPTAPAKPLPLDEEFKMRQALESYHSGKIADAQKALNVAWGYLSHSDRHVRYAARVVIEKLPVEMWREKALNETQPMALIEGIIALARVSGAKTGHEGGRPAAKPTDTSSEPISPVLPENEELQGKMLLALGRLAASDLSLGQQLAALRAVELILTRLGKPSPETCAEMAKVLDLAYPAADPLLNRELCQILVAIDSTKVVPQTLALMATAKDDFQEVASDAVLSRNDGYANAARAAAGSRPNAQQIAYMFALRNATAGWTPESRKTYFSWFPHARTWKGGNSFSGFIDNIRKDALATFAPKEELAELEALSSKTEAVSIPNYVAPKGPGKSWTVDEVVALTKDGLKGRNFTQGEAMYRSVMCATCHRFNGEGGSIGPDLTGSGNRYTMRDLMENIVDPSKVISDQYDSHEITKKDGSVVLGRIVVEENGKVFVMTNPFAPNDQTALDEKDIAKKQTRKISMMPPGLINALNQDELLDLVAYLVSGGNAQDKVFQR